MSIESAHHVSPGDVVHDDPGLMRGHGTYARGDGAIVASLAGVVTRVSKLVSVQPLRARYTGDVGDVVVGRVIEVGPKRWRIQVGSRQDAVLLLSSINLPGGVLRRRTNVDELNMRNFFDVNDLISAEVQSVYQDGLLSLHTRSMRYGKLINGQLVQVPSTLVKRCKSHFVSLPNGVHLLLGINGFIFISEDTEVDLPQDDNAIYPPEKPIRAVSLEMREKIARVYNAIRALSVCFVAIFPETIMDVYEDSLELSVKEMVIPERQVEITRRAAERRGRSDDMEM